MKKNNAYKSLAMTMYTIAAFILAAGFATVVFASAEEQGSTSSNISSRSKRLSPSMKMMQKRLKQQTPKKASLPLMRSLLSSISAKMTMTFSLKKQSKRMMKWSLNPNPKLL